MACRPCPLSIRAIPASSSLCRFRGAADFATDGSECSGGRGRGRREAMPRRRELPLSCCVLGLRGSDLDLVHPAPPIWLANPSPFPPFGTATAPCFVLSPCETYTVTRPRVPRRPSDVCAYAQSYLKIRFGKPPFHHPICHMR